MLIGYARVSKSDGSQVLDLQRDALIEAGVEASRIYEDLASGRKDDRPGLTTCLKALQPGNTLVVWTLDRLGRDLKHLVGLVDTLNQRQVGFKVLAGAGAQMDTTTTNGRLVFGLFAALAEFEAALIRERTKAGLTAARARGRVGGRPRKMTATTLKMAMTAMADPGSSPKEIARRLGMTTTTLYTYVNGDGSLKAAGQRTLSTAGAADHQAVRRGSTLKSKP
jgi:DNA invertase Pin-like site-specific DNA recombinase